MKRILTLPVIKVPNFRFATLQDTHLGKKSNHPAFVDMAEEFFTNHFFPIIDEMEIKTVIHLGDEFDVRQSTNHVVWGRYQEFFLDKIDEKCINYHIIPGNHNAPYRTSNKYNVTSLMYKYTPFTCYDVPTMVDFHGFKIGFLPWICCENLEECLDFIENESGDLLCGHLEIVGATMQFGTVCQDGLSHTIFGNWKKVISGHFHEPSIYQSKIHYLGASMPLNWGDYQKPRGFYIATVYDDNSIDFQFYPYENSIFHLIEYDDSKNDYSMFDISVVDNKFVKVIVYNRNDPVAFDKFIHNLSKRPIHGNVQVVDGLIEQSRASNVLVDVGDMDDTRSLISKYIDFFNPVGLDKKKLDSMMGDLYLNAKMKSDD